jgi:coenzyme Q-binding protein COQ10
LPYAPHDLCALVADVKSYPDFIPWLKRLDISDEKRIDGARTFIARAEIGWAALKEHFSTQVRAGPDTVDVTLVDGPFKSLENHWRFAAAPDGAVVDFYVAYEFRNPLLQAVAAFNRDLAAARIMQAFEAEAHRRLGGFS